MANEACAWSARQGGEAPVSRGLGVGVLVGAGTAASLAAADLHGILIALAIGCASASAGIVSYAGANKKNAADVTLPRPVITQSNRLPR